jgi:hypothetical protein
MRMPTPTALHNVIVGTDRVGQLDRNIIVTYTYSADLRLAHFAGVQEHPEEFALIDVARESMDVEQRH